MRKEAVPPMNLHLLGVKSKILSGSGILTPLRALLQF